MAAKFFQSGPAELVAHVLRSCDTVADVLALRAACRRARGAWLADGPGIIWSVWPRERPLFDLALVAVRATEIVKRAENLAQLPPKDMDLDELSGRARKPSIAELRAVLDLHHLVRAVEIWLSRQNWIESTIRHGHASSEEPELVERMPDWSLQVHRAIYLSLILGAALAGVYREPLFRARNSDDPELQAVSGYCNPTNGMTPKQLQFLLGFAVCQTQASQGAEQDLFERLARWLIRAILSDEGARRAHRTRFERGVGRALRCRGADECPVHLEDHPEHSDGHLVVWRVMQALCAHDWIKCSISFGLRSDAEIFRGEFEGTRADIVPFGDFVVQAFGVPKSLSRQEAPKFRYLTLLDASTGAAREPVGPGNKLIPFDMAEIWQLFVWLHDHAGQPNTFDDEDEEEGWGRPDRTPPLRFKFFEYVLRHLGLRLHNGAFYNDPGAEIWNMYENFTDCWGIFTLDDDPDRSAYSDDHDTFTEADILDGSELLVPYSPLPDLHFAPPN